MKKYRSGVEGRRDPLSAEFNETISGSRRAVPEETAAPSKREAREVKVELTVEIGRTIVSAIAAGNFPSVAAGLAGVSLDTLEKWLTRGEKGEQPFADFTQAFRKAELEGEAAMVEIWRNAATSDWRAIEKYLARRHPERWSDQTKRDGGDSGLNQAFQINIHIGERQAEWDESVRLRAIELEQRKQVIDVTRPEPDKVN